MNKNTRLELWGQKHTHTRTHRVFPFVEETCPSFITLIAWWRRVLCIFKQFDASSPPNNEFGNKTQICEEIVGCLVCLNAPPPSLGFASTISLVSELWIDIYMVIIVLSSIILHLKRFSAIFDGWASFFSLNTEWRIESSAGLGKKNIHPMLLLLLWLNGRTYELELWIQGKCIHAVGSGKSSNETHTWYMKSFQSKAIALVVLPDHIRTAKQTQTHALPLEGSSYLVWPSFPFISQ